MNIGILGAGQLGQMLALAGYPLGLRFRFFDPRRDAIAGRLGEHVCAEFSDRQGLAEFSAGLDVATFEFENVPATVAYALHREVPVYPQPRVLDVLQDRLTEKGLLRRLGLRTAAFAPATTAEELQQAFAAVGSPAILKSRRAGFDGRGQARCRTATDAIESWRQLGQPPVILEAVVPFARELSLVSVRGRDGEIRHYPLVENHHVGGILHSTRAPAARCADLQQNAEAQSVALMEALKYVGVIAIEFFECDGELVVNEVAPRVHNSGHWTIEGADTSQFENHLRAILGWPLGSTAARGWSVMMNVIGTPPAPGRTADILRLPNTHLHLYGKTPYPHRKIGHVTTRMTEETQLPDRLSTLAGILGSQAEGTFR